MAIHGLADATPVLPGPGRYWIAPGAQVIGRVILGDDASVWFNAVIRGDNEPIRIGARTNIQDGAVLHSDEGVPLSIGADCTIGHRAILHGATIGEASLIGMGAIVLNGAVIGPGRRRRQRACHRGKDVCGRQPHHRLAGEGRAGPRRRRAASGAGVGGALRGELAAFRRDPVEDRLTAGRVPDGLPARLLSLGGDHRRRLRVAERDPDVLVELRLTLHVAVASRLPGQDLRLLVVEHELAAVRLDHQHRMPVALAIAHDGDEKGRARPAGIDKELALEDDIVLAIAAAGGRVGPQLGPP